MKVNLSMPGFKGKVGVIGGGAWGTAIAQAVADNGYSVNLWIYEKEVAEDINNLGENTRYLPGVKLSRRISATTSVEEAVSKKDYILMVPPSVFIPSLTQQIAKTADVQKGKPVIAVFSKGFIPDKFGEPKLILDAMEEILPPFYKDNLVYVSGPSHAEEVGRGKLTGLISASKNPKNSIRIRNLLTTKRLLVFSSLDTTGVQVSAALKNVIAIAFGVLDALKDAGTSFVGDNTESLLLAAGLNEIQTLGIAMGATHPETFSSIAGVGDLDVTCRSIYGRNRRFGREIMTKNLLTPFRNIDDLISKIDRIGYLPEGVFASRQAYRIAKNSNLRVPIIKAVYRILNKEANPTHLMEEMLEGILRKTKPTGLLDNLKERFFND
ncbi:NAD(P)H-dependent glycerol-3-phosphate dehydrogenase [Spirochaetia bacterium 38H-sp]|uniref:Glycerol-3-phosphate dehydrogenase [NAD(P)+] n=1 Tax=Rarispira pelagica TaxID=3141764 RepID=A0ABU9U9Z9_9SPIR